jgi:peptidoglycan/xylan/chitin deacetylase (PgdA/CDA1 family)
MKQPFKNLLGQLMFLAGFDELLLRNAAVVVAFHRVHDTFDPSGLTISPDTFERHCAFFKQHFDVVPLRDLVDKLHEGVRLDHHLAITFDDGYLDNYENAAPVLEKLSLPATFFVVTQFMGSDGVPWWDVKQGVRHPWMTWDHVRSLKRMGFDIGGHTRTHVDLGAVSERVAKEEILGARLELQNELAGPVDLFAYPYGRRRNLDNRGRDLVKAVGFRCCCSSFGGINVSGGDPFQLRRVPISPWYATPQQFGLEVAFRRSELLLEVG